MKQIIQNLKNGLVEVVQVPVPSFETGQLCIQSRMSLLSTGTEKMLLEFGKANWLEKARQNPEKVRLVINKIKNDGLQPAFEAVLNKLDKPIPLGYCNVGHVVSLGASVQGFARGERVVSNGNHAEVVSVNANLCAKVPDEVSDEEAAFTVIGAIALQGIRLVRPTLGESIVVTGLGLIGLLTVQLLRANGCRVLGLDLNKDRLKLARDFGAEVVDLSAGQDPIKSAEEFTRGRGVDAVILTAATKSSEPMHQAAQMCRKRGRIVLVGVTGLELSRDDYFKKELSFQVSASYGPGRYDHNYEEKGQDYPIGFVRWTAQRNFEAVLDMMAQGSLNVKPLVSHKFDVAEAQKAFELITGSEPSLGILINYSGFDVTKQARTVGVSGLHFDSEFSTIHSLGKNCPAVSFIGAGNYATSVLIPAFSATNAKLQIVASKSSVSSFHAARKYSFQKATTDAAFLFSDIETDAIVITTRHDSHAKFVLQALESGKHVFVEKPLCLTLDELSLIESAYTASKVLMVGFNRRFAPQIQKMKSLLLSANGPKAMVMTVNAGAIPIDDWTQDLSVGGGRIIGEACHFIDLLRYLVGVPIVSYQRLRMDSVARDTVTLQLGFADGSIGTIHYFTNGSKNFPKERLEIFASGGVLQLDNYRNLTGFGWAGFKRMSLWRQNKGQQLCAAAFVDAIAKGEISPIPAIELFEVTRVSIALANQ